MLARDHYATLGVPPDASQEEIEAAYRHLCRRYHPDINPGDPQATLVFERIEEAYLVLSDPERRARYDSRGSPAPEALESSPELQVGVLPEGGADGSFAELFRALQDHARRSEARPGEDLHATVSVPLAIAERGRRMTVTVRPLLPCQRCDGRGRIELQRTRPCDRCDGTGQEVFSKGVLSISCHCADCGGDGLEAGVLCNACNGSGLRSGSKVIAVRVPPGVSSGDTLRIHGDGHHGRHGGPPGDLLVRCLVEEVPGFEREGPHLSCQVPIAVDEAILGGRIQVPTLEGGEASVRLPPGTQSGQTFRVRRRGLRLPDGRRGDMLVTVDVRVPELVDEDSKELIRSFAARNPYNPRAGRRHGQARR